MTDEFLTKGLQNDRYLKALRLASLFEDKIEARLREFDQQMVDQHPDLFDSSTNLSMKTMRSPSSTLVTHRINHLMDGTQALDSAQNQKLNVHLYWMNPTDYGRTDIDGALRAFGYKIKNADTDIDARVAEQTRNGDWSIDISGNPFDSNKVFYRHVNSVAEIEETTEILVNHFSTFGGEYATASEI